MYRITALVFIFLFTFLVNLEAQSHFPGYFAIYFTNKNQNIYSVDHPEAYLSAKAIERKARHSVEINSDDFPVNQSFIDTIVAKNIKIKYCSRWLNAALVELNDSLEFMDLSSCSFLNEIIYLGPNSSAFVNSKKENECLSEKRLSKKQLQSGYAYHQLEIIGANAMHEIGFKGEGVSIAILDAGYAGADQMSSFSMLYNQHRILDTYDFPGNNQNVYVESFHGTYCLSTIAGEIKNKFLGSAPLASFYLYRTEVASTEFPVEEFYWLVAAERADSLGVDIISTSLGYNRFDDPQLNYNLSQLDGKTSLISKAAQKAADKGILLINSAGNEGQTDWRKISFPADVKDLITVGAINSDGKYAPFSSVGNTQDGRIKPDLVCIGQNTVLLNSNDEIFMGNGTSFSAPTLAGASALLIQAFPSKKPSEIRLAMLQSASQYSNPDSLLGYGVPNVFLAYLILKGQRMPELYKDDGFQVLPNPFSDEIFVYFTSSSFQSVSCELYNSNGKKVKSLGNINPNLGNNIFRFDGLQNLNSGVYFLRLSNDQKQCMLKIVKA